MSDRYVLRSSAVNLALDAGGRLVQFGNPATRHDYLGTPGHAIWRMFYRSPDAIDLEISPDDQQATVSQQGGALVLRYDTLVAHLPRQGEKRVIQVALTIRVALDGDTLTWTAEVQNREPGIEITELWLPWIYGLGNLGLGRDADILYWPERGGRRIRNPQARLAQNLTGRGDPGAAQEHEWLRLTYPFPASMQWYTLNDGEEGIYVGSHDPTLMVTCLNVMAHRDRGVDDDGTLSASIIKYPFVKSGESWVSEPIVVRLYTGDWHVAARTYRAWADTWYHPPEPPAWIRRAPGWVKPFMKNQQGLIRAVYSDLPGMLQRAQAVGMNILHFFGWVKQGFDNRYPHYAPDEALGGEEGLKRAIAQVEDAGGKMILYTQGQLVDPSTEFYRTKGHRIVARDIWGHEYREQYAFFSEGSLLQVMRNKWFGNACPSAPGWLEQLISQFEMVQGFGAQGILYDQMGGMPPYICYADNHEHSKPSLAYGPYKVRNMKRLREVIKARDPEFAFVTELVTDCYCPYIDIIHSHGIGFWPAPESFGEMFLYTFPEPLITHRADVPDERQKHFGFAFTMGLRFDANTGDTENPAVASYLGRLCALRNAHPELLLEGRFVDNEGFVCDNSEVSAHSFLAGDRLAVTLWNPTAVPQAVRIAAPGYVLQEVAWQDPSLSGTAHMLKPGDVALYVFRQS
jgi:hypothetical protein